MANRHVGSANTGVGTGVAELTDRNHYTVPLRLSLHIRTDGHASTLSFTNTDQITYGARVHGKT